MESKKQLLIGSEMWHNLVRFSRQDEVCLWLQKFLLIFGFVCRFVNYQKVLQHLFCFSSVNNKYERAENYSITQQNCSFNSYSPFVLTLLKNI